MSMKGVCFFFWVLMIHAPLFSQQELPCPTFGKPSGLRFSLLAEGGVIQPLRNLQDKGTEPGDVFALRDNNESAIPGYHLGVFGKVEKLGIPLYLRTGLVYEKNYGRINLTYSTIERDTMRGLISVTTNNVGDTITYIYGNIVTETEVDRQTKRYHSFQTWEVPVIIGFTSPYNGFLFHAEAGIFFNISNHQQGSILTDTDTFTDIDQNLLFQDQLGISYMFGFMMEKPINTNAGIYLSLNYRYIPRDFSISTNPISQKYQLLGLNVGYRWSF